ncbi:unnamed protein product [Larinioides sclopetarius]|uniref:Uncharacterized protein n=1 Tax=Larinioides sclopetarius TaxID=280406 RepID=A0AAV2BJX3_9ARAC
MNEIWHDLETIALYQPVDRILILIQKCIPGRTKSSRWCSEEL